MYDQLFGSKTRVKLLSLFLNHPNESFYVREITRRLDEQINSIRRELANLQAVGLVKSEQRQRRLYYKINPRFASLGEFQRIFAKAPQQLEAKKNRPKGEEGERLERFSRLGNVAFAMLTGAFLKNKAPVDVFVVGDINKVKFSKLMTDFEREMGQELNFTVMSPDEYYYRRSLYDRFLGEVLSADKVVIIDAIGVDRSGPLL
jgi:DNA-binding transcriptional ArsR family regulator